MSEQKDADLKLLDEHVDKLMEHFDSVQIFATRQHSAVTGDSDKNTMSCESGGGNFYARMGQVREWLIRQDTYVEEHARKSQNGEDDEK